MSESQLRLYLNSWLEGIAMKLNFKDKDILEIGIAGDDKPSGSYKFFGEGNRWSTMDKEKKWEPDYIQDITEPFLEDNSFDVVIMTQALEHIWNYKDALKSIYNITRDYAIIDCPFMYKFHQDVFRQDLPWDQWDDYHRLTPAGFKKALKEAGFEEVEIVFNDLNTLAVCRKHLL